MNLIGKKNVLFGFAYLVITLALGMFLAKKLGSGDTVWMDSGTRALLKTAHVHGNLEAVLNIIVGILIARYGAVTMTLSKVASILGVIGAIFHSGMLFLGGLGFHVAMKLTPIGAISLLGMIVLMLPIISKGMSGKHP